MNKNEIEICEFEVHLNQEPIKMGSCLKKLFCLPSNLSNDDKISVLKPGLKTSMDFRGLIWKRAWKIGLK